MREFIPIDTKALKRSTRILAVIAGIALIAMAVYIHSLYTGVVGVIILAAMSLNKRTSITEEGLEVVYEAMIFKRRELWSFDEIQEIHKELSPDGANCALHIMKDIMSRRLVFPRGEVQQVIDLALEKNPKIHVADVNKY